MKKPAKYDFGGIATKYNVKCSDGKTIKQNAFKECDGVTVPLVWNHKHDSIDNVLGHAILEHRADGVYAYCTFNNTPNGKLGRESVANGDICSLSICANKLKVNNANEVMHGVIREVSLVLAGANPKATIDTVSLTHSDESGSEYDESIIRLVGDHDIDANVDENGNLISHSEEVKPEENHNDPAPGANEGAGQDPKPEEGGEPQPKPDENGKNGENLKHADKEEKTIKEVLDSMNDEQLNVTYFLVGLAHEEAANNGGKSEMKHNAFEDTLMHKVKITDEDGKVVEQDQELTHAEQLEIINEARKSRTGSLKDACLEHSVTGIENLMPEYKLVNGQPKVVDIEQDWVNVIMNGVNHVPFQKIRSIYFDLTEDEARAKGWLPANVTANKKKIEQILLAFKRETDGQMVYKRQSMHRDEEIDITDFDIVAFIKSEMRSKLREEIARAILVGDGREALAEDKIKEDRIRPIAKDTENNLYTIAKTLGTASSTVEELADLLVDASVVAQEEYKGSGNITAFVRRDVLSRMLLLKDQNKRRIYKDVKELETAMLVSRIVPVPSSVMGSNLCVMIDLKDYTIGSNPKGGAKFFDDFDIDFNKMHYLIEQKLSGANVTPYSAFVFTKGSTSSSSTNEAQG